MPITHCSRSADLLPGQVSLPNANPIRVDSDTDTMKFGTGVSGTTEKELMDLSSAQTVTGIKTFTGAQVFSTLPVMSADGGVQYAEIALTNAEIKALRATPKALVAAPGAAKIVHLIRALIILDAGANVLTEVAANLDIRYAGKAAGVLSTTEATGFIDGAADQAIVATVAQDKLITKANSENLGLELFNNGAGEYGGNAALDALLRVKVWYSIFSTGW